MVEYLIHKTLPANTEGTDYYVGDLHGMYDDLMNHPKMQNFDKSKDRLISVGDLIDRGPNSMECLQLTTNHWFHSVIGNHEDFMFRAEYDYNVWDLWMLPKNGGYWSWNYESNYPKEYSIIKQHVLKTCPIFLTVLRKNGGKVGVCHATSPSDWNDVSTYPDESDRKEFDIKQALWNRTKADCEYGLRYPAVKNVDFTVHGHTVLKDPKIVGNSYYIDTGAVFKDDNKNKNCRLTVLTEHEIDHIINMKT